MISRILDAARYVRAVVGLDPDQLDALDDAIKEMIEELDSTPSEE